MSKGVNMTRKRVMSVQEFLDMVKNHKEKDIIKAADIFNETSVCRNTLLRMIRGRDFKMNTLNNLARYYGARVVVLFDGKMKPKIKGALPDMELPDDDLEV